VWHWGGIAISAIEWCAIVHVVPPVAGVTPRLETEKEMSVRGVRKQMVSQKHIPFTIVRNYYKYVKK